MPDLITQILSIRVLEVVEVVTERRYICPADQFPANPRTSRSRTNSQQLSYTHDHRRKASKGENRFSSGMILIPRRLAVHATSRYPMTILSITRGIQRLRFSVRQESDLQPCSLGSIQWVLWDSKWRRSSASRSRRDSHREGDVPHESERS